MAHFKNSLLRKLNKDLAKQSYSELFLNGRRVFLKNAGIYSVGAVAGLSLLTACKKEQTVSADIAIIGGGLAGLHALKLLHNQGIKADLYEASGKFGGRVKTLKVGEDFVEQGGEFINTDHEHLLNLLKELGLKTKDVFENHYADPLYFIDDMEITYEEIVAEIELSAGAQFMLDMETLPEFVESGNVHLWKLYDSISIETYLKALKIKPWLYELLTSAYEVEFGMSASLQSAMNLLSLFDPGYIDFDPYGDHDKRFVIEGGSEGLIEKLLDKTPESKFKKHQLISLEQIEDNSKYKLSFSKTETGETLEKDYTYVIITLPYTALRGVKISAPISEVRTAAIQELGYGNRVQTSLVFKDRVWEQLNFSGEIFTNQNPQKIFANQNSQTPILTLASGGEKANELSEWCESNQSSEMLTEVEKRIPGTEIAFSGEMHSKDWSKDPLFGGSFSCYAFGQWTKFYGSEGVDEGNLFFAGEHTSRIFQSTMNGAIQSSIQAVEKLLEKMK